jgi:WD40 repeat protein
MRVWKAHDRRVTAVTFSPDGRTLASTGLELPLKMWDVGSGRLLWATSPPNQGPVEIPVVAFSPNGRWLAAAEDRGIRVREPETGDSVAFLPRPGQHHFGNISALAFTPDGERLVMDASPGLATECRLQWWQTGEWTALPSWEEKSGNEFLRVAVTPDGRTLATMTYQSIQIWDIAKGHVRWSAPVRVSHYVTVLVPSPDGIHLAYAAGPELSVLDVSNTRRVTSLCPSAKHIQGAAFSPEGQSLVTVSNDETAVAWDPATWAQKHAYAWRIGKLKCVAFSPDGQMIAAGGDSGKIVIWDAA